MKSLKPFLSGLLLLITSLSISIQAQAKPQVDGSLSSLILDLEEFKTLSVEDQAKYLIWSRELLAVLETFQADQKTDKLANFQRTNDWSIDWSIFPQAEAALPLALIPYAVTGLSVAVRSPAVINFASRAKTFSQTAWRARKSTRFQKGGSVTDISFREAGKAKMNAALIAGGAVSTAASVAALVDSKENEAATPAETQPVPKPAPAEAKAIAFKGEYREVDAKCLFGGHLSKFKKFGDKILCTRPKESINAKICTDPAKSFLCQSFGLSQGPSPKDLSSKLCVPLTNEQGSLVDLTPRCAVAFRQMLLQGPTLIDPVVFNNATAALKESVGQFQKEGMRDGVSFEDYCKDSNAINKGLQKSECEAITGLMALIKQDTQVEKVVASRAPAGRGVVRKKPAEATN